MTFNSIRKFTAGAADGPGLLIQATSANGVVRNSPALSTNRMGLNGASLKASATIVTALVTASFSVQVSDDAGTTWRTMKLANNADVVATAAGAGQHDLAIDVPASVVAWPLVRVTAVLAGAATAAGDVTSASLRWARIVR